MVIFLLFLQQKEKNLQIKDVQHIKKDIKKIEQKWDQEDIMQIKYYGKLNFGKFLSKLN